MNLISIFDKRSCIAGFCLSATLFAPLHAAPECGDFLAQAGKKPAGLEFVECKPSRRAQVNTLEARYRVPGKYAHFIEDYLVRESHMAKLGFACCGWENQPTDGRHYGSLPIHGELPHPEIIAYRISMGTGEAYYNNRIISQRDDWHRIPWFSITVEMDLELP